jgi:hypothetical protein
MIHATRYWLKSRHPLARVAAAALALVVVSVLVVLGHAVFALLVVRGAVFMLVRTLRNASAAGSAAPRATTPGTIEGEFVVVKDVSPNDRSARLV